MGLAKPKDTPHEIKLPSSLLSTRQAKMDKSTAYGHLSAVLHLTPAYRFPDGSNSCPWRGQCAGSCLVNAGRMRFDESVAARLMRTVLFWQERNLFLRLLLAEIAVHEARARARNLVPTIRLNGTSDLDWAAWHPEIFDTYPNVQFIDYTKEPERLFRPQPSNYHLTYSYNEKTPKRLVSRIYSETRFNVATVFKCVPDEWTLEGEDYSIVHGDMHDLRHLDPREERGLPAIVGLRFKPPIIRGKAREPRGTFVIL